MTAVLETRDLTCGYGKVVAVRNLDLELEHGKVMAVLGPNGAGKTTLMMTLAGLLPRLGGEVVLDGQVLPSGKPSAANSETASLAHCASGTSGKRGAANTG